MSAESFIRSIFQATTKIVTNLIKPLTGTSISFGGTQLKDLLAAEDPNDAVRLEQVERLISDIEIPDGQVNADWNSENGVSEIFNKPQIPAAQIQSDWNQQNDQERDFIKNKPPALIEQLQSDWNQSNNILKDYIKNKPDIIDKIAYDNWVSEVNLALSNIPDDQIQSDWNQENDVLKDFIKNKPRIPSEELIDNLVVNRGLSTDHAIARFKGTSGKEIEDSLATIDDQGQMVVNPVPDENGYAVGIAVTNAAEDSYGVFAAAKKMPLQGASLNTTAGGKRAGLSIRADSEHMNGGNVGFGLNMEAFIPVSGWILPSQSERLGGFISFVIAENEAGIESVDIEFWSLREGVMTKQGVLNHHGIFTNLGTYREVVQTYYTSALGGESQVVLMELIGNEIIQIIRNIQPLIPTVGFVFDPALGKTTLPTPLDAGETLYFIYKKLA
jgi:hypothetical protein